MADLPDWAPPGVDPIRANTARVYDYLLGGSHNFLADQDAARALTSVDPGLVYVSLWRPDSPADVPEDPSRYGNLVGVAQKPS